MIEITDKPAIITDDSYVREYTQAKESVLRLAEWMEAQNLRLIHDANQFRFMFYYNRSKLVNVRNYKLNLLKVSEKPTYSRGNKKSSSNYH